MFKKGDVVECFKLHDTFFQERLGQVATVIRMSQHRPGNVVLSAPFNENSSYRADCFRLLDINLENE